MENIFSFETTGFDFEFINHVRKIRTTKKLSAEQLSLKMGVAKSFVNNVESYTQRHKYSTRHISLLAKAFGYKNISELMDFPTPQHDRIKVTVKQVYNETGTKVMESEVVGIEGVE